jgi:hypothetical protein
MPSILNLHQDYFAIAGAGRQTVTAMLSRKHVFPPDTPSGRVLAANKYSLYASNSQQKYPGGGCSAGSG